jgi:hypothetical protein
VFAGIGAGPQVLLRATERADLVFRDRSFGACVSLISSIVLVLQLWHSGWGNGVKRLGSVPSMCGLVVVDEKGIKVCHQRS